MMRGATGCMRPHQLCPGSFRSVLLRHPPYAPVSSIHRRIRRCGLVGWRAACGDVHTQQLRLAFERRASAFALARCCHLTLAAQHFWLGKQSSTG